METEIICEYSIEQQETLKMFDSMRPQTLDLLNEQIKDCYDIENRTKRRKNRDLTHQMINHYGMLSIAGQ